VKLALVWGALLVVGVGCGGMPAIQEPKKTDTPGKPKMACNESGGQARPLIVDWSSSDRAELEARSKRGVAVVRYEGCSMEVLKRCKAPGAYDYIGLTPKTDRIVMRDATEMYANIPVYAAKFEGKLAQAGELSVAMNIVGQYESTLPVIRRDQLEGDCDGATHVVSSLTVGAFEFFSGQSAEVGGGVQALGAGAGGSKKSSQETLNRDGSEQECGKASDQDKGPPHGCGALLRVEVVPIGEARKAEPSCPASTAWNGDQCVAVKANISCPEGQIPDKERGCVAKKVSVTPPPRPVSAPVAAADAPKNVTTVKLSCADAKECGEACDKDDARACFSLGGIFRDGRGVPKDGPKASTYFQKACDKGELVACSTLGEMNYQGLGIPKNGPAAVALFTKACEGGEPTGCVDLGWATADGVGTTKDPAKGASYFASVCNDKTTMGCLGLGLLTRDGRGVPRDAARAKALFEKACKGGLAAACKMAQ